MSADGLAKGLFWRERDFAEHIGKRVCVVEKNGVRNEGRFVGRKIPAYKNMSVVVVVDVGPRKLEFYDYEVDEIKGFYY